jgi:X-Pro dipeptidyl-peptidase
MGTTGTTRTVAIRWTAAWTAGILGGAGMLTLAAAPADAAVWTPTIVDGRAAAVLDPADVDLLDVWITTPVDTDHDGQPDRVHAQISVPRVATGGTTVPIVVTASPYFGGLRPARMYDMAHALWDPSQPLPVPEPGTEWEDGSPAEEVDPAYWTARGYAFAKVATIGTELSTGCPRMLDRDEAAAMRATVEWLTGASGASAELSDGTPVSAAGWSSGKVGMTGLSYDGSLPLLTATTGVAGLEMIAPQAPVSSFYDYYRYGGMVYSPSDLDDFVQSLRPAGDTVCTSTVQEFLDHEDRATGDQSDFWDERDLLAHLDDVRTPTLIAQGQGDYNVRAGQSVRWYEAMRERGIPATLYLHTRDHIDLETVPESGWQEDLDRWLAHYLYGVDNGVENDRGARVERSSAAGVNTWDDYPSWPVPASAAVSLFPAAGGDTVSGTIDHLVRGGAVEQKRFLDDPSLTMEDLTYAATSANRALYRSAPLQQDLHLSGTATAQVALSVDRLAANVTLAVVDTDPVGNSFALTRAWIDPQNRTDLRTSEAIVPGAWYDLTASFVPVDYIIPAGNTISLMIASSDADTTVLPAAGTALTVDTSATTFSLPIVGGDAAVSSALGAPAAPGLSVANASIPAGTVQTVTGTGLAPDVALTLTPSTGTPVAVRTDATGGFTAEVATSGIPVGTTTLRLSAARATLAETAFEVTAVPDPTPDPTPSADPAADAATPAQPARLAATGVDGDAAGRLALGASLLAGAGAALLVLRRTRIRR